VALGAMVVLLMGVLPNGVAGAVSAGLARLRNRGSDRDRDRTEAPTGSDAVAGSEVAL
jgi:hypothetical protein